MASIRKDYLILLLLILVFHLAAIYLYVSGFIISSIRIDHGTEFVNKIFIVKIIVILPYIFVSAL